MIKPKHEPIQLNELQINEYQLDYFKYEKTGEVIIDTVLRRVGNGLEPNSPDRWVIRTHRGDELGTDGCWHYGGRLPSGVKPEDYLSVRWDTLEAALEFWNTASIELTELDRARVAIEGCPRCGQQGRKTWNIGDVERCKMCRQPLGEIAGG